VLLQAFTCLFEPRAPFCAHNVLVSLEIMGKLHEEIQPCLVILLSIDMKHVSSSCESKCKRRSCWFQRSCGTCIMASTPMYLSKETTTSPGRLTTGTLDALKRFPTSSQFLSGGGPFRSSFQQTLGMFSNVSRRPVIRVVEGLFGGVGKMGMLSVVARRKILTSDCKEC